MRVRLRFTGGSPAKDLVNNRSRYWGNIVIKKALLSLGISALLLTGVACEMDPAYQQAEEDMKAYNEAMAIVTKAGSTYIDWKEQKFLEDVNAMEKSPRDDALTTLVQVASEQENGYYTPPEMDPAQLDEDGLGNMLLEARQVHEFQITQLEEASKTLSELSLTKENRQPSIRIAAARGYSSAMEMAARIRQEQATEAWSNSFAYRIKGMDRSMYEIYQILTQADYLRQIDYSPAIEEMQKNIDQANANKQQAEQEKEALTKEIETRTQAAAENNKKRNESLEKAGKDDQASFTKRGPDALPLTESSYEHAMEANRRLDRTLKEKAQAGMAEYKRREASAIVEEENKLIENLSRDRAKLQEAKTLKDNLVKENMERAEKTTELFISHFTQWNLIIDHQVNDRFDMATEDLQAGITLLKSVESQLGANEFTRSQTMNLKIELGHSKFVLADTLLNQADINLFYVDFLKNAQVSLADVLDNQTKDAIDKRIQALQLKSRDLIDLSLSFSEQSATIMDEELKAINSGDRKDYFAEVGAEQAAVMQKQMDDLVTTLRGHLEKVQMRDKLLPENLTEPSDSDETEG